MRTGPTTFTNRESQPNDDFKALAKPRATPLNSKLIDEIVVHISLHRGLDENGRAHPSQKKLPVDEVEAALCILSSQYGILGLKPYHLSPSPNGTWQREDMVAEVVAKKCDQVLQAKFNGDLFALCTQVSADDLFTPLVESLGGRRIEVSMSAIASLLDHSPYQVLGRYLQLKGVAAEFEWFKPYHMTVASQGTWRDATVCDEVLKTKCNQLLESGFGGDLVAFCLTIKKQELLSPLDQCFAGRSIRVSMSGVCKSFNDSPYLMIKRYLTLIGHEEAFQWLRPYHMAMASLGTWNNEHTIDEILYKKCEEVLASKFSGDLQAFCTRVVARDLLSPLIEHHGGREVEVSMGAIGKCFNYSPEQIVRRYLQLRSKQSGIGEGASGHRTDRPA